VFFEGATIKGCEEDRTYIKGLWRSASCYDHEIEDNIYMLRVLETIPSTIESIATVNDIIICSLRNVLIRKLANAGVFVFSWNDVIAQSLTHNFINEADAIIMRKARIHKNAYRLGIILKLHDNFVGALEKLTQKVIDKKRKIKFGSHKEVLTSPEREKEGSYSQLRAIELLCSHYRFHVSMKRYNDLIKDPAYFSSVGPNKALQRTSR
jgi:hypothetical protein